MYFLEWAFEVLSATFVIMVAGITQVLMTIFVIRVMIRRERLLVLGHTTRHVDIPPPTLPT